MVFINYRPISLLSIFSKILERLMYDRLLEFLNKHKILNKFQFGFRNMHSIFMALITLLDNLRNALDSGNCAVGIFLDFQKAFDTVNHKILMGKLNCYGIRGIALDWFSSYLTNRSQTVITMNRNLKWRRPYVECHKGRSLVHSYSCFTLMIYHRYLTCLCSFYLQMTQISFVINLIWMSL